jgi:hypothetical protein
LIALVHPAICSSHGMPGRPVHFASFSACAEAGAVIDASPTTAAKSISAPASAVRTIVFFTDHPPGGCPDVALTRQGAMRFNAVGCFLQKNGAVSAGLVGGKRAL